MEAKLNIVHSADSPVKLENSDSRIARQIIDQDGDVLVITGRKELLIASKILATASSVFRAMFTLRINFLEGRTTRSPQCPYELPLPDDDPDTLESLFNILHFSNKHEVKPEADLVLNVLEVADKYDCTGGSTSHHVPVAPVFR